MRKSFDSLDFIVREESTNLMAFLHVIYANIYKMHDDNSFITKICEMKFKMKLSYSSWKKNATLRTHVFDSINKTIKEKE